MVVVRSLVRSGVSVGFVAALAAFAGWVSGLVLSFF